ncbi:MAG: ABC transporter ATP-binding protein [Clostridiales bacterium]|jgi:zinc transport system ATP-binding protein|nr:ABC transporter ATP-binding protein [Clostridiales bacterium]
MAQINAERAALGFDGNVVVKDITFCVHRGDYLCIVGENGAGKSTLLKALLGLHKHLSGTIELGDGLKRRELGYLPQQRDVQKDFPASVREIVLSGFLNGCGLRPFYNRKERTLAEECMKKLGVISLADRCYRELSGGQQQRVLLVRALCAAKKMILLDEPAAGLDPQAAADMYDIIYALNRDVGVTVVMVSHDIDAVLKYSTHVLHVGKASAFFCAAADYAENAGKGRAE